MLPKSQRLNSSEVEEVMSKGQTLFTEFFLIKFLKGNNKEIKISALAPKKSFSTAVERNKIRRKIYAALSPIFKKNPTKKPFLVVIIGNKKIENIKTAELASKIEQIFIKGGIL